MKLILMTLVTLLSAAAFGTCDISEAPGTAKKYAWVLQSHERSANVELLTEQQVANLPKEVIGCLSEVDLSYEMGDGYYDINTRDLYVVFYPNSQRIAGYIESVDLFYTEGDNVQVSVKYNRHGQRISPIGSY